jgi:hypothetical protein
MRLKALAMGGVLALAGCAGGPDIWDRPHTTRAQFDEDAASCRLSASESPQQRTQVNTYAAGSPTFKNTSTIAVGPDPNAQFGGAVRGVNAPTEDHKQVLRLCMQSKGYTLRP